MKIIKQPKTHIRWMIRRDMPGVLEIERHTPKPWVEENFLYCLRQRNCIGMVVERGDNIIGFMVYTLHMGYLAVENFAVHQSVRRTGIGSLMAEKLIAKLVSHRRDRISLTVRETNDAAIHFFRAMGFLAVGIECGRYHDTGEDGYRMEYRQSEPEPEPRLVNRILKYDAGAP